MQYPRGIEYGEPFEYLGHTLVVATYEAKPDEWMGSFKIACDGVDVPGASVANAFSTRSEAHANVLRIAKDTVSGLRGS